jgi:FkbM family methyltransferase
MKSVDKIRLFRDAITGDENARSLFRWKILRRDALLYRHSLQEEDLVYDVGGYHGDWTCRMLSLYPSQYRIFEPHPEAFSKLTERFPGRPEVSLHEFALGGANGLVSLSCAEEGSSIVSDRGAGSIKIRLIDVCEQLRNERHPVALIKLNIEGAEFDLLETLLWSDALNLAGDLLVQFHSGAPRAEARYLKIAEKLRETHHCVWRYPFLWELWRRIKR